MRTQSMINSRIAHSQRFFQCIVVIIKDTVLKMLYLAMMDITRKWTGRRQDWSLIHAQLAIYFEGRIPE